MVHKVREISNVAQNDSLSSRLAAYLISLYKEETSAEILDRAKAFFSDTFAVMLAGCNESAAKIASDYADEYSRCNGLSTDFTSGKKIDAAFASMVNGVSSHIHDFDDVCTTMVGHPSVTVLPAVVALGEELKASGKQILKAYIVGIETCALFGRLLCPEINKVGWHSTETIGVFGATVASGCLLDMDIEQMSNAIGIAASEACALKANYGTMTKSLHAGRACEKGIFAARMAKKGFTASPKALEGANGYIQSFNNRTCHLDALEDAITKRNSEFLDAGLTMKPWPCCKGMHNAIWALMELQNKYDLRIEQIEHIDARVLPFAKDMLIYSIPNTPLQGKFSMNYALAKTLLSGNLLMKDFEGSLIKDQQLIETMKKINMVVDESLIEGGGYYDPSECEQVDVYLKDGTKLSNFCDKAKGTPENPMNYEERVIKMKDCISYAFPSNVDFANQIISKLSELESLADINELTDLVSQVKTAR